MAKEISKKTLLLDVSKTFYLKYGAIYRKNLHVFFVFWGKLYLKNIGLCMVYSVQWVVLDVRFRLH